MRKVLVAIDPDNDRWLQSLPSGIRSTVVRAGISLARAGLVAGVLTLPTKGRGRVEDGQLPLVFPKSTRKEAVHEEAGPAADQKAGSDTAGTEAVTQ